MTDGTSNDEHLDANPEIQARAEVEKSLLERDKAVATRIAQVSLEVFSQILSRNVNNKLTPDLATGMYSISQAEIQKVLTENYDDDIDKT
jgi:hypothetical protein